MNLEELSLSYNSLYTTSSILPKSLYVNKTWCLLWYRIYQIVKSSMLEFCLNHQSGHFDQYKFLSVFILGKVMIMSKFGMIIMDWATKL